MRTGKPVELQFTESQRVDLATEKQMCTQNVFKYLKVYDFSDVITGNLGKE